MGSYSSAPLVPPAGDPDTDIAFPTTSPGLLLARCRNQQATLDSWRQV